MKSIRKTLCMALVLVMAFSGAAMAGRFGGGGFGGHHGGGSGGHHGGGFGGPGECGFRGPGGGFGGGFRGLNLTDEQKTAVNDVLSKNLDEKTNLMDTLATAKENMGNIIHADEFNEVSVREAFQQMAAALEELAVLKARTFSEIRPILTPEQLEQLKERKAERVTKMKERMAARQSVMKDRLGIESE